MKNNMVEHTIISPYQELYKKIATWLMILVFFIGVSVLMGWYLNITILKSIFPGIVNMNPLTAVSFILISIVIFFSTIYDRLPSLVRRIFYLVAIFVILVGLSRFLHIFFGIDFGLDQILFHQKILKVATQFSKNRIAPNTALNLILVGMTLILLLKKKKYGLVHSFAFITFSISLFAILGYLYSVKNLYGFLAYTPMALNTALCFLLVSISVFLSNSNEGIVKIMSSTSPAGITARRLIPLVIFIPSFLGWLRILGVQHGWYNTEVGLALLTILTIMIFLYILYWLLIQLSVVDSAKTEFVSLASHQLRTPLSAINWYSEMLLTGDAGALNPKQVEFVKEIADGNTRMVKLVNSLLNVSRIDLGTFAVEPELTDIREIIKSVLEELHTQIEKEKLKISVDDKGIPESVKVDPKLIRIVIQNLLSNAVKYNREGGDIHIILKNENDIIDLTISDTGYGIPKDQQGKIFTKLFRADNAIEKAIEGNGLGMYVVRAIIEQCKGTITFSSEENKGTVFHVLLPLKGIVKKEGAKGLA